MLSMQVMTKKIPGLVVEDKQPNEALATARHRPKLFNEYKLNGVLVN